MPRQRRSAGNSASKRLKQCWVHRTLNDAEGELFAKILKQAGRGADGISQGNYLFSPNGNLLAFADTAVPAARVKRA